MTKSFSFSLVLSLLAFLLSCETKQQNSTVAVVPDTVTKVIDLSEEERVANEEAISSLADSLELQNSEIEDLEKQKSLVERKADLYYRKIHILQSENDSLRSVLHRSEERLVEANIEEDHGLTPTEQSLRAMVFSMHQSWKELNKSKDPERVLRFFLPKFTSHRVAVLPDNQAQLTDFTRATFTTYLQSVADDDAVDIEFGDVFFLDEEVKDEQYFNIVYKCQLHVYRNDRLTTNNDLVVTLTGKRVGSAWKIGNYSWVSFQYKD